MNHPDKNLVFAHLVIIDRQRTSTQVKNPCGEIHLPPDSILMEPKYITLLRLQGFDVFNVTESLDLDGTWVSRESCYEN